MENETKNKGKFMWNGFKGDKYIFNDIPEKVRGNVNEEQLQKLENDWRKEHKNQKGSIKEIMDQQWKTEQRQQ